MCYMELCHFYFLATWTTTGQMCYLVVILLLPKNAFLLFTHWLFCLKQKKYKSDVNDTLISCILRDHLDRMVHQDPEEKKGTLVPGWVSLFFFFK